MFKKVVISLNLFLLKVAILIQRIVNFIIFYLNVFVIYLRQGECSKLKDCYKLCKLQKKGPLNSERTQEYPWILENFNKLTSGKILDVGSTVSELLSDYLPPLFEIYTLDLNEPKEKHHRIKFIKGDIRKTNFPDSYFDVVTCVSTLEHVGVAGRYNSPEDLEGDFKAIQEIKRILKPQGRLLLTVPYGQRDVLPINKVYNQERLEKLFKNWEFKSRYSKFNTKYNSWFFVDEADASKTDMINDQWYAIGLFDLVNLK